MRARHSSSGDPRLLPAAMVSGNRPATCLNLQPEVGSPAPGHPSKQRRAKIWSSGISDWVPASGDRPSPIARAPVAPIESSQARTSTVVSILERGPGILPNHVRRRSRIKSLPPRSQGLDVLIAGVRDQGFSAATAKKAVHAVRDAWIRGLGRGEEVDVGCGHVAAVWRGGNPTMVTREAGAGGRLVHEESPEARAYQRDALPIRVAFRPSVAFSGELVELITPEFTNLQRWVPGQPPKKRRRKRRAARPEPAPATRTPTAEVKREPVSVADIQRRFAWFGRRL